VEKVKWYFSLRCLLSVEVTGYATGYLSSVIGFIPV
jgi:hypothetical protein